MVNKTFIFVLAFILCSVMAVTPLASASVLATSPRTSLSLCLQQAYLKRDTYQRLATMYPTLSSFATAATDETEVIAALSRLFARYGIFMPVDAQAGTAAVYAARATSPAVAFSLAIALERSAAALLATLAQTNRNADVAKTMAIIRQSSISGHIAAFSAEAGPAEMPVTHLSAVRPFPAPTTTRRIGIPLTIDASGITDASAALNTFIASVPDGSVISFPSGSTYRLDQGIQLANRHNLIFEGNGATLRVGAGAKARDQLASPFVLGHQYGKWWQGGNTDIVIHGFILVGNDPTPGTFTSGQEGQANLEITGTDRIEIYDVTGSAAPGDFVFINDVHGAWIHDCRATTVGRTGGTIISGSDITFENNIFGVAGYCIFNIEPNTASEATHNAQFLANTAISWDCAFLSVEGGHTGASVDGVVADGNIVMENSIRTVVDNGGTARMRNVIFTNNTGRKPDDGPVLVFAHIDNLMVAGNAQPLSSGSLMKVVNSTMSK